VLLVHPFDVTEVRLVGVGLGEAEELGFAGDPEAGLLLGLVSLGRPGRATEDVAEGSQVDPK
jgi:hypothetical protein